jgi:hypothetical protein
MTRVLEDCKEVAVDGGMHRTVHTGGPWTVDRWEVR